MKSGPKQLAEYHQRMLEKEHKVTNRQLLEEGVDLNRATEKVASILADTKSTAHVNGQSQTVEQVSSPAFSVAERLESAFKEHKARKRRADLGTTRAKPAEPAQAGKLSESQWAQIRVYFERVEQSTMVVLKAQSAHDRLLAEAHDFIDSLAQ
jgi:hypothetical protein